MSYRYSKQVIVSALLFFTSLCAAQSISSVSINTAAATFSSGEPIELRIVFTNKTDHPILLPVAGSGVHAEEDYRFIIQRGAGISVPLTALGRAAEQGEDGSAEVRTLNPGESVAETVLLSRFFDMSLPGTYKIEAQRKDIKGATGSTLPSNTLTVKVTP